jgi:sarcosine oxidase subunit alpha
MSWREGTVANVKARIMRISFSGELSFEINVPSNAGAHVWKALMAAGKEFDITPYGTEAMHVLRGEKGYIIVGQDTDGSMTPFDLAMGGMVSKTKDFLGRRSLSRSHTAGQAVDGPPLDRLHPPGGPGKAGSGGHVGRKQLVGLLTEDPSIVLPEGAQLTALAQIGTPSVASPVPMIGHVTSSYWSPTLNRSIAMAVVRDGHQKTGQTIYAALSDGRHVAATIGSTVFYDPEGKHHHD